MKKTRTPISDLIKAKFSTLSSGQKKVAEFIVSHLEETVWMKAYQIGQKAGVSETTVIRFAFALGFAGFSELQNTIRQELLAGKQMDKDNDDEVIRPRGQTVESSFQRVIQTEKSILDKLLEETNTEKVLKTVDALIRANRVYIGGFRSSFAAAYWFYYTLSQLRENVWITSPTHFLPEHMCDLDEDSAVVVISFPRYTKEAQLMGEQAKKQKVKLISITDRPLSPIGQISDLTLITEENMASGFNSIASVISLMDLIITGFHQRDSEQIGQRQKKLEQMYTRQQTFLE
ncbi:RpiR family transcriptional regulator [Melghirimyces profundicolus]|uniref:RpiR family transcriptional regulator n=1 Tax=Melghirimyces profundicolus TaxID=1242148 RepID=A0A2T6BZ08_9BACL|nr:MurR/RpiR family transcriptional regulator [Melghirimyces profundicolus]PTX61302.1 RpiR family transcriptional regulator [Melghirimyces profundicolus]